MNATELMLAMRTPEALHAGARLCVGTVVECAGSGTSGHVYRVVDDQGGMLAVREYAPPSLATRVDGQVQPLPMREAGFEAGRKRFDEDGEELAAYDHPGLLKVLQLWSENGTSYQAMPWCEGRTLDEVIRTAHAPPDPEQLAGWLRAMADALAPVHRERGLHGHLSPSQVMLLDSGRLLVMEFSRTRRFLARDPHDIERDPYAALECSLDARFGPMGPWTDIYALAAIVHFALRGRPPQAPARRAAYDAQEPLLHGIEGDYAEAFLHGIDCGLALRPRERPRDLATFLARAGLHERRSRPRSSTETLLINLDLLDVTVSPDELAGLQPDAGAGVAAAATPTDAPAPLVVEDVLPIDERPASAAPDDLPGPTIRLPPRAEPRGRYTVQAAASHPPARQAASQSAPGRTRVAGGGVGLAAGALAMAAVVAIAVIAVQPFGAPGLQAPDSMQAAPAARTEPPTARAEPAATPGAGLLAGASADASASSPIPEPLEPTAAGPASAVPFAAGSAAAPTTPALAAEPVPASSATAEPAVAEPAASPTRVDVTPVPPAAAPALQPAPTRPAARALVPAVGLPGATQPADAAAAPASPCPDLLARQYIGRPLDSAEREVLKAQCL